jgi:hypothetical protein
MAKWIKLTEFCFYQRLGSSKSADLNFSDIHSIAIRKLGSRRKGFDACAVKFSIYQPPPKFEDYTVEATCTIIIPKRAGIKMSVFTEDSTPKSVPGADAYTRVLAVKKGTTLRTKTLKSSAGFNNIILLYDTNFNRTSE